MAANDDIASQEFTATDIKLITSAIKHLIGDINTDWEKVALDMGYKTPKVGKDRWRLITKKKGGASSASAGSTKRGRAQAKSEEEDAVDGGAEGGTKGKGKAARAPKKPKVDKKKLAEVNDEDEDEDGADIKIESA